MRCGCDAIVAHEPRAAPETALPRSASFASFGFNHDVLCREQGEPPLHGWAMSVIPNRRYAA
jgi:hypothetical protein